MHWANQAQSASSLSGPLSEGLVDHVIRHFSPTIDQVPGEELWEWLYVEEVIGLPDHGDWELDAVVNHQKLRQFQFISHFPYVFLYVKITKVSKC